MPDDMRTIEHDSLANNSKSNLLKVTHGSVVYCQQSADKNIVLTKPLSGSIWT